MKPNKHWPSMFKVKPSSSHDQFHEPSNSSAISGHTPSSEVNQERSTPETKPRWNPKPEQLRILESLFNSGMVGPSRDEIKRIASQLQEFGQVGDANVFYWFQNKKARSKQRQRHLHAESSKSSLEKTGTNQSTEIINGANVTTNSLPSIVPATAFSTHQENYHVQTNGQMSNAQCSYMQAVAAAAAGGEIFNQGTSEDFSYARSITVLINNIPVELPLGSINVRAVFGENAVLFHSTGHPVLINEWGYTLECLQHGATYYMI